MRSLAEKRLATAQRSESKALAIRASTELEGDGPATTVRIALAGLPKDTASGDRPFVAEAEAALLNGLRFPRASDQRKPQKCYLKGFVPAKEA